MCVGASPVNITWEEKVLHNKGKKNIQRFVFSTDGGKKHKLVRKTKITLQNGYDSQRTGTKFRSSSSPPPSRRPVCLSDVQVSLPHLGPPHMRTRAKLFLLKMEGPAYLSQVGEIISSSVHWKKSSQKQKQRWLLFHYYYYYYETWGISGFFWRDLNGELHTSDQVFIIA